MTLGVKGFVKGHKHSIETRKKIGNSLRKKIYFNCDYCKKSSYSIPCDYNRNKRHFCDRKCYSKFRKKFLTIKEQNS